MENLLNITKYMPALIGLSIPEVIGNLRKGFYWGGRVDAVIRHIVASGYRLTPSDMEWMGEQLPTSTDDLFYAEVFALRGYRFSLEELIRFKKKIRDGQIVAPAQAMAGHRFSREELQIVGMWEYHQSYRNVYACMKEREENLEHANRKMCLFWENDHPLFGWEKSYSNPHPQIDYYQSQSITYEWGEDFINHGTVWGIAGPTFRISISGSRVDLMEGPDESIDFRVFVQLMAVDYVLARFRAAIETRSFYDFSHLNVSLQKLFIEKKFDPVLSLATWMGKYGKIDWK